MRDTVVEQADDTVAFRDPTSVVLPLEASRIALRQILEVSSVATKCP